MKKSEITVGMIVDFGGDVATVTEITPNGIVVETENGEDIVAPSNLKPFGRGRYDDEIAERYEEPYRPSYRSSGRCEDAPCCGCCG